VDLESTSAGIGIEVFTGGAFSNDFTQVSLVGVSLQACAEFVIQDVSVYLSFAIHELCLNLRKIILKFI
jgi:hypothetical protein